MHSKLTRCLGLAGVLSVVVVWTAVAQDYPLVPYKEAADHMDQIVWIEGTVLRAEKAAEGTYLLFSANEKYVRLLIPAANLGAFDGSLSHKYTGKRVKAVGKVAKYGYKLIVGVSEPKRIKVLEES